MARKIVQTQISQLPKESAIYFFYCFCFVVISAQTKVYVNFSIFMKSFYLKIFLKKTVQIQIREQPDLGVHCLLF